MMIYYWVIIDFSKEPIEITKLGSTGGTIIIDNNNKISLNKYN